ncbi:MAG: hypothetical protein ACYTG6_01900 [Planctomycetota bacterium]|jgi:hypothetical protein
MKAAASAPWILLVGVMAFFLWGPVPSERGGPEVGPRTLLDRVVMPGADGVALAFTLPAPGRIELRAQGEQDAALRLAFGPPAPVDPRTGLWEPDPDLAVHLRARGEGVLERSVEAVGTYVVKVLPIPSAMEPMACEVRVQVLFDPAPRSP